jgi:8-oxo-dGTP pyrophosphatase MutT (NUDIX family)
VNVVGMDEDGAVAFVEVLGQGTDPRGVAFERGFVVERPLEATRNGTGDLDLRIAVRPVTTESRPPEIGRGQDAGLRLTGSEDVEVRQRVAAYAIITSELGLLATEFSDRTAVAGRWGLPGGGIDDHEQPSEAVLREVMEETHQLVELGALIEVQTSHWVGRSPRDTIEDYHAVRLVYEGACQHPTTPVVLDVGGTTESARWVARDQWDTLAWTVGWRQILEKHFAVL